ncbi:MAG: nitrate- and nitrite sensing domain-containing protein [Caulobacterales bacterium]
MTFQMGKQLVKGGGKAEEAPSVRFLRSAQICRTRDLKQLLTFSDLIKDVGDLIHALQKERGASAGFLGSSGAQFCDGLHQRILESRISESAVRNRLDHIDEQLDRMSSGARFYTRVALCFKAMDAIDETRQQIAAFALAPQDAVKIFTDTISSLLAVIFEAADIAADPTISQAMVALVNFIQGKEFAGQERATGSAGFSRGHFETAELRRLRHLLSAQNQAFQVFAQFADPANAAAFEALTKSEDSIQLERMRNVAFTGGQFGDLESISGEVWYEQATRRMDVMMQIENQLTVDLRRVCQARLAEASTNANLPSEQPNLGATASMAVLVRDADPALNDIGQDGGVGLYSLGSGVQPKLMRSILDVVQAQSRRLHDVSNELESARNALTERKVVERAKALLMSTRQLSEPDAYALMRKTAMNQHKRLFEVAEAILSMADILKTSGE